MRAQRQISGPISIFRKEALRGEVSRAAAQFRILAGRYAREKAPPKGQEALASANFNYLKQIASDVAAFRCEMSSFRASIEAQHQAIMAFNQELLSSLVSFLSLSLC